MKKILFVINQIGGGGAERVISILANKLSEEAEIEILYFRAVELSYQLSEHIKKKKAGAASKRQMVSAICREIKTLTPDCVISFEYHMNLKVILASMKARYKGKLIVSERNDPVKKGGRFPIKQVRDILYRKVDHLVCQTPEASDYFKTVMAEKKTVIPNPVSSSLPEPYQGERSKRIVNFCRLESQKRIPLLIEAFADFYKTHSDYRLDIYGEGVQREELETTIASLPMSDKITLHHFAPDIHNRILDAAMFVSTSDYEGLSNSMLEAMALGIPTICTDCPCGGAHMVIKNGVNGILIPVNDKESAVKAMISIADDTIFARKIAHSAIEIREAYSIDKIMDKWLEIIS